MNLPLFIARRYLFAKKSSNAINIISAISVTGVTVGTMALVIVLSVFNGFDNLVKSLFNSFDPDLKISLVEGKTFIPGDDKLKSLSAIPGVIAYTKVVEENALIRYEEKQLPATIKGVDDNYLKVSGLDSMIVEGSFVLKEKGIDYAVIGQGISYYLSVGLGFVRPLTVYMPKKAEGYVIDPANAFNTYNIHPKGIFSIEQEYDQKYFIVPFRFAAKLLDDSLSISAIEIKVNKSMDADKIQGDVQHLFGDKFTVKNRYEQKELFYKIMKYEKWAIFFILSFILMVASFNIIGSLSMLIIEKKNDILTFQSLGADKKVIRRIFLNEGLMISTFGALVGTLLGVFVCWIQLKFGIIKLSGSGSFIIDAYPVAIQLWDIVFAFLTVLAIGFFAAWYPVRLMVSKYLV
ncbi:MAG TPA: FtsX-like permease family protein [Bacteroidales bacterium]|nr:FtsX-like permease family protein [Bacteroidales bacterium]